jgi:hypothetical protein
MMWKYTASISIPYLSAMSNDEYDKYKNCLMQSLLNIVLKIILNSYGVGEY